MKVHLVLLIFICIIKKSQEKIDERNFTILKHDKDFIKPKIKLNAEFELIKMKNGMKGLLIHDPYTTYYHVHFNLNNGSSIDSFPGLTHLYEHMACSCSKNYNESYHILRHFGGINGYSGGATSGYSHQEYFYTMPFNFKFEKGLRMITDSFIKPLFPENHIKKEIQAINAEFNMNIDKEIYIIDTLLRTYSAENSTLNLMATGNNITLDSNKSEILERKLKSYFNIIVKPENFFFTLYSSYDLKYQEKLCEKYLNYDRNEFPEDEIDIIEKENLIKNIDKIKEQDFFKDDIFLHGFYFSSHNKKNQFSLLFYISGINLNEFKFDVFEFFSYLFQSESLLTLLKNKNYILSINDISTGILISVNDKHLFEVLLILSQNGVDNLDDVVLILYKYIDIIKKEGYKKKYFNNYIKYKENFIIKKFQKEMFTLLTTFSDLIENYRQYGEDHILDKGAPSYKEYNETTLKFLLNKINYEKSFFTLSTRNDIDNLDTFLDSVQILELKFYNIKYMYGGYPLEFKELINDGSEYLGNLFMRKINPYFSEKEEGVIPCYKQEINKCKIMNEFDFENDEKYNGILLEEDENIKIYYQIDKSSESFLIKGNLEIHFDETNNLINEVIEIFKCYLNDKLSIINEVETISIVRFDKLSIGFNLITFTDNTELIYRDFLNILTKPPSENEFEYAKMSSRINKIEAENLEFKDYIIRILNQFMNAGYPPNDINQILELINSINYEDFIDLYKEILKTINSITLKIAGNLDVDLVKKISNLIKQNLQINKKSCDEEINEENPDSNNNIEKSQNNQENKKIANYIIDYIQKSENKREKDGAIFVIYRFDQNLTDYMQIFKGCMDAITRVNLRLEKTHSYHPNIFVEQNFFMIYEQGRYKEPHIMEEEIDELLLDIINGKIVCDNYNDIVTSFKTKQDEKIEKNLDNLFNEFITGTFTNDENVNSYLQSEFPHNFKDLMEQISYIFTEPKRYTILVYRSDIPDNYYQKIIKRKRKNNVYLLNKNMKIFNTEKIDILRPRN